MKHRFFEGLSPTLHISHRGGAKLAPENTLTAFRPAVEKYRTQMLELDVQLTLDGQLIVAHDGTLERCTDATGPISALSYSELCEVDAGYRFTLDGRQFPFRGRGVRIPLLTEVLGAFPQLKFNLELKPASAAGVDELARLLREAQALGRVCCGSEDDAVGAALFEALPEGCHFYPRWALATWVMAVKRGELPPDDDRYTVLDLPLTFQGEPLVDRALCVQAGRLSKWVNVWTVDEPQQMRELIAFGVGGVMTDRPDLLRAVLDSDP